MSLFDQRSTSAYPLLREHSTLSRGQQVTQVVDLLTLAAQALHVLLKTLDAALAPVPGLSKHNYGASQHGFCVSAGLTGRCDDHAAAALDAALRLQEAARQVCNHVAFTVHLSTVGGIVSSELG